MQVEKIGRVTYLHSCWLSSDFGPGQLHWVVIRTPPHTLFAIFFQHFKLWNIFPFQLSRNSNSKLTKHQANRSWWTPDKLQKACVESTSDKSGTKVQGKGCVLECCFDPDKFTSRARSRHKSLCTQFPKGTFMNNRWQDIKSFPRPGKCTVLLLFIGGDVRSLLISGNIWNPRPRHWKCGSPGTACWMLLIKN